MIQRRQTLFLFLSVFLGIALMFFPTFKVLTAEGLVGVFLIPLKDVGVTSTTGHLFAVGINFIALILASITVFIYKKRELQLKICYMLLVLWLILTAMLAFCPFIEGVDNEVKVTTTYLGPLVGILGIIAVVMAARFIKKDIALIKSADRIR